MDRYIGKLLDDRYEILERIGTGGMAVVYKGRDHRLNRLVAIKILKDDLAQDEEFRRRFHDESRAVAMLSHPNIMAVYDVSTSGDMDYIVMELLDGITLKQYMQRRGGKLSWKEALHFIIQIMKALSHAHSRGIIHRDIKPHNIMVLRDGSIKVADFGIARLTSACQNTMTQEALGSVHYISPEQARGSHIDARSDIYSAGVVLYEMLTGRLPYEGDSPVAVAIQHINSIPLSPRELEPDIPEALEAITLKAMASDVNKRYISADAMLADLEEFRRNPSISFDLPEDIRLMDGEDEPTQIIGANTPSAMTGGRRPARPMEAEDATQRIPRTGSSGNSRRTPPPRYDVSREEDRYPDELEERPNRWPIIAAAGAILIFLIGIGVFLVNILGDTFQGGHDITIPNLLGYTIEDAMQLDAVKDGGFTIQEVGDPIDSSYPEGTIATQSPKENAALRDTEENRVITVQLSKGTDGEDQTMPNLVDEEQGYALQLLKQMKDLELEVETTTEPSEDIEEEHVIRTDPEADTVLTKGQTVTVVVSSGKAAKSITVPPLTGLSLKRIDQTMLDGLDVTYKYEYDAVVASGLIIDQSIEAGTQVQEGASLTLIVSKGPAPAATPSPAPEQPSTSASPSESRVSKTIVVDLSSVGGETVRVRVMLGDSDVYPEQEVSVSLGKLDVPVTGDGDELVSVIVNGELVESRPLDSY
ncbi:Stk1 family PASTA domain-containing Ser/Thr kinase [Pseudoflavonifractor sp. MSJ-37]|uniref:Stk1 family PASTA domain-containing Ser/Thr kinase n=1 Tax=Pseudoflavonifractor sp. MSJ-37 TaxID=2841531 RepID=UPI001C10EFF2|nr:Stk1 family PASTA domain-containing Ser/Thr kinase [Pseudoflavonifractor sp. MSJ-37]MBU5434783.1 Stk1 family PASTA domain-containing Ser/Thr kinase [Pseudoflavonifractor sp. MSJ-37]